MVINEHTSIDASASVRRRGHVLGIHHGRTAFRSAPTICPKQITKKNIIIHQ